MIEADGTFPIYSWTKNWWDWFTYEELKDHRFDLRKTWLTLKDLDEAMLREESPELADWAREQELTDRITQPGMATMLAETQLKLIRGEDLGYAD